MKDLYPDYVANSQNSVIDFSFGGTEPQYCGADLQ